LRRLIKVKRPGKKVNVKVCRNKVGHVVPPGNRERRPR